MLLRIDVDTSKNDVFFFFNFLFTNNYRKKRRKAMLIFEEFALKNKSTKQNEVHISKPNDKVNLEKLNFFS